MEQFEEEVKRLRGFEKKMQELAKRRETLVTQQNENELVARELELLEPCSEVFKLIGPALVRQSADDARDNVRKRLDFITGEIKNNEQQLKETQEKAQAQQAKLQDMQRAMQQQRKK
eukprot:m51a1_g2158 hypothetical protein (117) ;mRNA; r:37849-38280